MLNVEELILRRPQALPFKIKNPKSKISSVTSRRLHLLPPEAVLSLLFSTSFATAMRQEYR
jgi:hypothetical protein